MQTRARAATHTVARTRCTHTLAPRHALAAPPPPPQILLDSEGIDAYNQTAQDGVQLLSLAVLLSSMFVFNQMGPIDEAAIDRLGLVTEVSGAERPRAGARHRLPTDRRRGTPQGGSCVVGGPASSPAC